MRIRTSLTEPLAFSAALFLGIGFALTPVSSVSAQEVLGASVDIPALLDEGDHSYEGSNFKSAVETYGKIINSLEGKSGNENFLLAVKQRYAQAAVARAKQLASYGSYEEAKTLLTKASSEEVVAGYAPALDQLGKLDNPTRYNPALTKQHTDRVVAVARSLREAEGAYELGDYDKAFRAYENVLRIDPYNKAARRGMERVNVTKSDYYISAGDETRARMLAEVDSQWELAVPPEEGAFLEVTQSAAGVGGASSLSAKTKSIVIPVFDLEDTTIQEALELLRELSMQNDTQAIDPNSKGIDFVLNLGDSDLAKSIANTRFDLQVRGVPVIQILEYITQATQTAYRIEEYAIFVKPLADIEEGSLLSRSWSVPPDFLSRGAIGNTSENAIEDPFVETSSGGLPKRLGVKEFLESNGIAFPEGSSASFNANSSQLVVRNTSANIEAVDRFVELIKNSSPSLVKIDVKLLTIDQESLTELGYDWAIGQNSSGNFPFGGGVQGNGSPLTGFTSGLEPVTSGNRSGDFAISQDSIDSLLTGDVESAGSGAISSRAPGILSARGSLNTVQFESMLRGLNQSTGSDVLSVPTVTAKSGTKASVRIVREIIYPTEYEPAEVPDSTRGPLDELLDLVDGDGLVDGLDEDDLDDIIDLLGLNNPDGTFTGIFSVAQDPTTGVITVILADGEILTFPPPVPIVTPSTPTSFETREVGTILEVNAQVDGSQNYIDLQIIPEIIEFEGFVNYGTPISSALSGGGLIPLTPNVILQPIFSKTGINSSVTIRDGATLVLGGLQTIRRDVIEDKVPILGSLPYLGRFFKSDVDRTRRTAVLIFVTVNILDPSGAPVNP